MASAPGSVPDFFRPNYKPNAGVHLYRRGRHVEDDHIMVTTPRGDVADSHNAVLKALRAAKIDPIFLGVGSLKITFDPHEISGDSALAFVTEALRSGGVSIY